jgi:hypothetical protein
LSVVATVLALVAVPNSAAAAGPPKIRQLAAGFNFTCAVTTTSQA